MNGSDSKDTTVRAPWSAGPREGWFHWLRRVISGNLPIDAEIARLRQELEWANERVDQAEFDRDQALDAAWREGESIGYEVGYHRD